MAEKKPNQKQIASRYSGVVDYSQRPHYLRTLRGRMFLLAVILSVGATVAVSFWGKKEIYSPGAISRNHASFANDCRACHQEAPLNLGKMTELFTSAVGGGDPISKVGAGKFSSMDVACLRCHGGSSLHLPQAMGLRMQRWTKELTVVHATGCASCHQEHVGEGRMAVPSEHTCISCHASTEALKGAQQAIVSAIKREIPPAGENRDLGDGVVRFLTPPRRAGSLAAFASYAQGHPPFAYESEVARDPGVIRFNHERHLRGDLPKINGHQLNCADCHRSGADGAFMQPIQYEQHCAPCHTLQFQPNLGNLRIPHGDAEKVRLFLSSIRVSFERSFREEGMTDPLEIERSVEQEVSKLDRRGLADLNAMEKRVFFDGEPASRVGEEDRPKFMTECSKCHTVESGSLSHAPKITLPNFADRWIQHGPFTHLPHGHMACTDCHGAAIKSKRTSDILLPAQALCAECHRAPETQTGEATQKPLNRGDVHRDAALQRLNGGIQWDCMSCHRYHAPADAGEMIKAKSPTLGNRTGGR